jgi:hypothetical protein
MSHPPGIGGSMCTQSAEIPAIRDSIKNPNQILIDKKDWQIQSIVKLLYNYSGVIFYGMDSHITCAARGAKSVAVGNIKDGGLAEDIKSKIKIATALGEIEKEHRETKPKLAHIIPQLYTFDPHDGTITLGNEMHAFSVDKQCFTAEVNKTLFDEQRIVNTWMFIDDPEIKTLLEDTVKPSDIRNSYSQSIYNNWQAITKLYDDGKGSVFIKILNQIQNTYQNNGWQITENDDNLQTYLVSKLNIEQKAKMMLQNLVTRWSIAKDDHHWPFDKHVEQGIVLTEANYGPGKSDEFIIFGKEDLTNMFNDVKLSTNLIRGFRENKGISDPFNILNPEDFNEAPIVISSQSIIRKMPEEEWQKLSQIDLEPFTNYDWDNPNKSNTKQEVEKILKESQQLDKLSYLTAANFITGVAELLDRMTTLLNDKDFRSLMLNGNVVVANQIVDENRQVRMIIPFIV